jgi:hypothetical protein
LFSRIMPIRARHFEKGNMIPRTDKKISIQELIDRNRLGNRAEGPDTAGTKRASRQVVWLTEQWQHGSSFRSGNRGTAASLWPLTPTMSSSETSFVGLTFEDATSHNSAYVHRRLGRRLGLRGAAARRSATSAPRLGQPRGRVTYARYVIRNCANCFFDAQYQDRCH